MNTQPRGLRNNNPLNIRRSGNRWQGMSETQTDPDFVQFSNVQWGYRAAFITLRTYLTRRGCRTVSDVVKRWAPRFDGNDTQSYLRCVSAITGFRPNQVLLFDNANLMVPLVSAMSRMETGRPALLADVMSGWMMATR